MSILLLALGAPTTKMVPVRVRTLATFWGPNPWTLFPKEEWTIEVCKSRQVSIAESPYYEVESLRNPFALKSGEFLCLRSDSDAKKYIIPYELTQKYLTGAVRMIDLPALLSWIGKVRMVDTQRPWQRKILLWVGIPMLFFQFVWVLLKSIQFSQDGTFHSISPSKILINPDLNPIIFMMVMFMMAMAFLIVGIIYQLRHRRICIKIQRFFAERRQGET